MNGTLTLNWENDTSPFAPGWVGQLLPVVGSFSGRPGTNCTVILLICRTSLVS